MAHNVFNTEFSVNGTSDSTDENFDVQIEWGHDFGGDANNDTKVTITLQNASNSGFEDVLGVAFDINDVNIDSLAGVSITGITKGLTGAADGSQFVSTFTDTSGVDMGNVADSGPGVTDPGFNTSGGTTQEPYDAFVKVSDNGAGEGIVQTFTFTITGSGFDIDAPSYLNGTDWWLRTTSTDGGGASAKTASTSGGIIICFSKGTGIGTPGGARAVEELSIGDPVLTASGKTVSAKWIGRQTVHKMHAGERMQPVRFRAGALGDSLPHADLTVTADHGMIIDDIVIIASALVNGTTIDWVPLSELPEHVTYYHVETEDHDVILANGAPAETFVDYVGRRAFDNHQEYLDLYGAERLIPEMSGPRISTQRLVPDAIRKRLGIPDEAPAFNLDQLSA